MMVCAVVGLLTLVVNQKFVPPHSGRAIDTADEALDTVAFVIEPPHF
jgi:hypothetical protein